MATTFQLTNSFNKKISCKTNISLQGKIPEHIVLLLHGFLSSYDNPPIHGLFESLAKTFPVMACNAVGEGEGFPSYTEYIKDLFDIITYITGIGISQVTLVGHSMGASVSLFLTAGLKNQQTFIQKLILIAMPEDIHKFKNRYHAKKNRITGKLEVTVGQNKYELNKHYLEDIYTYDTTKALKQITVPTLIIQGKKDALLKPIQARHIYNTLFKEEQTKHLRRRKQIVMIPNAGHLFVQKRAQHSLEHAVSAFILKQWK